jgi:hypothetical protein
LLAGVGLSGAQLGKADKGVGQLLRQLSTRDGPIRLALIVVVSPFSTAVSSIAVSVNRAQV